MRTDRLVWEESAQKALDLAKRIARAEGATCCAEVHVLKAWWAYFPGAKVGDLVPAPDAESDAIREESAPPGGEPQPAAGPMRATPELMARIRSAADPYGVVHLVDLLRAILDGRSRRVQAFLSRIGRPPPDPQVTAATTPDRPFPSRRDCLKAMLEEWELRLAAASSHGLRLFDDARTRADGEAATLLEAASRAHAIRYRRAQASPVHLDPLGWIRDDVDPVERAVCEGLLVTSVFGLGHHPYGSIRARDLAMMLEPEVYPGNARKVLQAIDSLESKGMVLLDQHCPGNPLLRDLRFSEATFDRILLDLEADRISLDERRAIRRKIDHGII